MSATYANTLTDSDIKIRRKAAFLFNTLLFPSLTNATTTTPSSSGRAGLHTQPSSNSNSGSAPVHPNSHASMTAESAETSSATQAALQKYGILDALVNSLMTPVPHGDDGDIVEDSDYNEKVIR